MKISIHWLKEFVDFDLTPEALGDLLLHKLGFDTAGIQRFGGEVSNVVSARVETCEKLAGSKKLSVCRVADGKDHRHVLCGAPNVAAGQIVAFARVGAELPGGFKIEQRTIMGKDSHGMICSARELGLGQDHEGILVLPEGTPLGEPVTKLLDMNDAVLDLEGTPNRPDALSHWGIAREVAAALGKKVKFPDTKIPKAKRAKDLVEVEDPGLCSRYTGRVIEGVGVKPAPLWMKLRLERCGIRSINNVVDVTNYVLLELGHPLHAFDRERLAGGRVVVRKGRAGENLLCLDGVRRQVAGALVIADAEKPAAVAGIMGGEPSSVTDATRNLLLESAVFQPAQVRRTRGRLNVSTESSYRFERGTDPALCEAAGLRAARLIMEVAGGVLTLEEDAQKKAAAAKTVKVGPGRINALLGTSLTVPQIKSYLARLDFEVAGGGGTLTLTPPAHRQDIVEEADVAEEIARQAGYDSIPARRRAASQDIEIPSRARQLAENSRAFLTACGFYEAVHYGLASRQMWEKWAGASQDFIPLDNPLSSEGDILSPSLLPNLLRSVQFNRRQGNKNVRLFETAVTFRRQGEQVKETSSVAWVAEGDTGSDHWKFKPRPLEFWDGKAWVKSILREWRVAGVRFDKNDSPFLHPAESQAVWIGDKRVGLFGRLHPRQAEAWDISPHTFLAELDLTALAQERFLDVSFQGLPKHPPLTRDFSVVFPTSVTWSAIALHLARQYDWVENIELFDVFQDASLPAGHRSLAFQVTLRHPDRTLTDAEAADIQAKILKGLETHFQARVRGASPN